MTSNELQDIRSEVGDILAQMRDALPHNRVEPVMRMLYRDFFPNAGVTQEHQRLLSEWIATIGQIVPADQIAAVRLADQIATDRLEKVLILQLAVSKTMADCRWLHHSLAVHLSALSDRGCTEALLPAMLHSAATLIFSPEDTPGRAHINRLMADSCEHYAPRAALYWAGQALRKGEDAAMGPITRLSKRLMPTLPVGSDSSSKAEAIQYIGEHFGWPRSEFKLENSTKAGLPSRIVVHSTQVHILPPAGDRLHYIFGPFETPTTRPAISVYDIEDGFLSVDLSRRGHTEFYVFDKNQVCYSDLSRGEKPFVEQNIDRFDGDLGSLGDKFCGPMNVSHFILDHLTRAKIYELGGSPAPTLLMWEHYDRYEEVLDRAGLLSRTKIQTQTKFTIQARRLLISSNATYDFRHPAHIASPWAIAFLRGVFSDRYPRPFRKLFISRTDSRSRLIKDFEVIRSVLERHRFEIVTLSDKTFDEQRKLFSEAEQVVGVHGAGLTNILFSPPGLKVMEILPPISAAQSYWILANGCGHSYRAFVAEDPEYSAAECAALRGRPGNHGRDIVIEPDRLDAALTALRSDRV